jgi:hypothetical protein
MPSPANDNPDYRKQQRLQAIENALLVLIDLHLGGEFDDDTRFVLDETKRSLGGHTEDPPDDEVGRT